jgi:Ran-interacting Mog1 protein
VYVGPGDDDPCFIIEILEYQESVPDETAAKYFFEDLAAANGSSKTSFSDQEAVAPADGSAPLTMFAGVGMQRFGKGRDRDGNGVTPQPNQDEVDVEIELCVIRLPQVQTDLLLTMSRNKGLCSSDTMKLSEEFQRALSTIQILDWDLFGS